MRACLGFGVAFASLASACATKAQSTQYFGKAEPPEGQVLRYISGSGAGVARSAGQHRPARGAHLPRALRGPHRVRPGHRQAMPPSLNGGSRTATTPNSRFTSGTTRGGRTAIRSPPTISSTAFRRGLSPALAARSAYLAYYIQGAQAYNEGKGARKTWASKPSTTTR